MSKTIFEQLLDAVIVGAGFSGLHMLHKLRQENFTAKILEAAGGPGGVWFYNAYPGARVDFDHQSYQYSNEELWKHFEWNERYPSRGEMQRYFQYVVKKLNLNEDILYNTRVIAAEFDDSSKLWSIKTEIGDFITAKQFILCVGASTKATIPAEFSDRDNFRGVWYHTRDWPLEGAVDLKGKRVGVIGTGASGVQVIQEISPVVSHLKVYQRTPNMALPMHQYSAEDKHKWQDKLPQAELFKKLRTTSFGLNKELSEAKALEATADERNAFYEKLYQLGEFNLLIANYHDILLNKEANDTVYQFWCEKTRARISDPVRKDILAPKIAPHVFGGKRPSMEKHYYEVFNQDNVDLINVNESPIIRITKNGIETEKEGETELDVIIFATGYDAVSGAILDIDITNGGGEKLQDKWKNGILTYLGISVSGYPNIFIMYGPQAPTSFANGPVGSEVQGDWIAELLIKMRRDGRTRIEAIKESEVTWAKQVNDIWNMTLFSAADAWYNGSNIPGKTKEALCYTGGLSNYISALEICKVKNYEGFIIA